jgi:tetratricopeptide (TPR) repeat protein
MRDSQGTEIIERSFSFFLTKKLVFFLLWFVFASGPLFAQLTDTLSVVKQLNEKGKYKKAEKLLTPYYKRHPGNLNAQWIYAQTTYLAGHFKKSTAAYEDAIAWHPENYTLRLDYAKKLTDLGEFDKAVLIFNLYLTYDSDASDAHEGLAKIAYWETNYETALNETDKVLKMQPNNASVSDLRNDIMVAKSPWLKIDLGGYQDDQPMQRISPSVESGFMVDPLANLYFGLNAPVFLIDKKTYIAPWIFAGDKMIFARAGSELNINAGIIELPTSKFSGTGDLQLHKTFAKHLVLSVQAAHQPYLNTRSNMDNPIMQLHYSFATEWNDPKSWQGRASFDVNHFYTEGNFIYTASAWVMTPPLVLSVFDFRAGYGYNYSTSKESRFVSTKSVSEIVADWETDTEIPGVYNPYFTPNQQSVHSAILAIVIHPVKSFSFGGKVNAGFYSKTDNPYLYLDKDAEENIVIERGFSRMFFHPVEANAYINARLCPTTNIKLEYIFMRTNFYTSNYVGLTINISFCNEKKTV